MWVCDACNTRNNDTASFCVECGAAKPAPSSNHCSNPNCNAYRDILPNPTQKYCGKCGSATTYWKQIEDLC